MNPKKIGLFWIIQFFKEIPEVLKINKNTIYASLYRNTGYQNKLSRKIENYLVEKYKINSDILYQLYTKKEFNELLLKNKLWQDQ